MTTTWQPSGEWAGATVAVIACGESVDQSTVEALSAHRVIAVNEACKLAPAADMLVALDGNWPQRWCDFAGMRVTGCPDDELDALYVGSSWEKVTIGNSEVEFRNSGLAAIRIAAGMGAKRIILAGFEPETGRRFHDDEVDTGAYVGVAEGLKKITAEMQARGVTVEHHMRPKPFTLGKVYNVKPEAPDV